MKLYYVYDTDYDVIGRVWAVSEGQATRAALRHYRQSGRIFLRLVP